MNVVPVIVLRLSESAKCASGAQDRLIRHEVIAFEPDVLSTWRMPA